MALSGHKLIPRGLRTLPVTSENRFCNTEQTSGMNPHIRDWQASSVPLKRFSEPREQGEPAVLLFSDKASYMTGIALREYSVVTLPAALDTHVEHSCSLRRSAGVDGGFTAY